MEANGVAGVAAIPLPTGIYVLSITDEGCEDAAESGDLDITDDLTISGAGAESTIVDGGGLDRVFEILRIRSNPSVAPSVAISGVTVRNGLVQQIVQDNGG